MAEMYNYLQKYFNEQKRQNKEKYNQKQWFDVKNILMMVLFLTNTQFFTSQDIWWTGVVCVNCGS